MSNHDLPTQFEDEIRRAFNVPPIRNDFVARLELDLINRASQARPSGFHAFRLRPAWVLIGLVILTIAFGTLIFGPQRVYAAIQQFLGYVPGFGLVETSAPLRVLAQPVSLTQDGITVAVNQAVLTATETHIDYGVSGVPLSAYPSDERVVGCTEPPYLILPDGTRQALEAPIPPDVNKATFVLPCIFNTLPGRVPSNWQLALRFVPAPPDFTVLPVVDLTTPTLPGSPTPTLTPNSMIQGDQSPEAEVRVEKVIETGDGYIVLGTVRTSLPAGKWLEITAGPVVTDARGHNVPYAYPNDVQPPDDSMESGSIPWALQFKAQGIEFPITLEFPSSVITEIALPAPVVIPLDLGGVPQPGQTWTLNQEFTLDRFHIRLVSVTADSREGYTFLFEANDPGLYDLSVEVEGASAIGGGGGRDGSGRIGKSLSFTQRPVGHLNLRITHLWKVEATPLLSTTWTPSSVQSGARDTSSPEVCLDANTLATLPNPPSSLKGTVIVLQTHPQMQIVRADLTVAQSQILVQGSARAAVSPDGDHLAYATEEGLVIQNLASGETTVIPGQFGDSLSWSPDAQRVAGVNANGQYGIFVLRLMDHQMQQVSNLGYESIAGWSPDGTRLYYTIPGHAEGFLLRAVDLQTGITTDLFTLERSSRKAPMAVLSPDGQWIAYRGDDNRSLYLKPMNGEPARLIMAPSGIAINGLAWEKTGRFLGVSLITEEAPEGALYLISPATCEGYAIPGISGALNGIIVP